jgi:hypothetical protein
MAGEQERSELRNSFTQIVTWGIGVLLAVAGFLAQSALSDMRKAVEKATERTEAAVTTLNSHSTELAVQGLRISVLEQTGKTIDQRLNALEQGKQRKPQTQ